MTSAQELFECILPDGLEIARVSEVTLAKEYSLSRSEVAQILSDLQAQKRIVVRAGQKPAIMRGERADEPWGAESVVLPPNTQEEYNEAVERLQAPLPKAADPNIEAFERLFAEWLASGYLKKRSRCLTAFLGAVSRYNLDVVKNTCECYIKCSNDPSFGLKKVYSMDFVLETDNVFEHWMVKSSLALSAEDQAWFDAYWNIYPNFRHKELPATKQEAEQFWKRHIKLEDDVARLQFWGAVAMYRYDRAKAAKKNPDAVDYVRGFCSWLPGWQEDDWKVPIALSAPDVWVGLGHREDPRFQKGDFRDQHPLDLWGGHETRSGRITTGFIGEFGIRGVSKTMFDHLNFHCKLSMTEEQVQAEADKFVDAFKTAVLSGNAHLRWMPGCRMPGYRTAPEWEAYIAEQKQLEKQKS